MSEEVYVVIVPDRYDGSQVSFALGPFESLGAAQDAWRRADSQMDGGYREHIIERLRTTDDLPEWERSQQK